MFISHDTTFFPMLLLDVKVAYFWITPLNKVQQKVIAILAKVFAMQTPFKDGSFPS